MDFKQILITYRNAAGISQSELAKRAGTTQQLIARYESGTEPKFVTGIAILKALNYDFSTFNNSKQSYYSSIFSDDYSLEYVEQEDYYALKLVGTEVVFNERRAAFEKRIDKFIEIAREKYEPEFKENVNRQLDNFVLSYFSSYVNKLLSALHNPENVGKKELEDIQIGISQITKILEKLQKKLQ